MLPDYTKAKKQLHDIIMKALHGRVRYYLGPFADIQSDDPTRIMKHLDQMANDIAQAQMKAFFEQLGKMCAETGQTFDCGGQVLTAESLFQMMENMFINFDEDGKAHELTFVFGPQMAGRVKEILESLETDPDLKKQHDELMERKRMQWRDKEASRKLVG